MLILCKMLIYNGSLSDIPQFLESQVCTYKGSENPWQAGLTHPQSESGITATKSQRNVQTRLEFTRPKASIADLLSYLTVNASSWEGTFTKRCMLDLHVHPFVGSLTTVNCILISQQSD